jgi:predicted O-linked N-acetylglucosamine transferase (SPINDLY family)
MPASSIQQTFDQALRLHHAGRLREADHLYRQILAQHPEHAETIHYMGVMASQMGHMQIAVDLMRRAIRLKPDYAAAWGNLGKALKESGQLDDAIAAYRQAIVLRADLAIAHNNLGVALDRAGQTDEAIAAYRSAIAIDPNFAEAHSNLAYVLQFHPDYDAHAIAEELGRWNRLHAQPLGTTQPHRNDRNPERRIRIGYVSPDFRDHVIGRNVLPLLREHNRERFEITCYSQVLAPDAITQRFGKLADRWRNIVGLSDERVAAQIREDRIDILVDLTLHLAGNRLKVFARKPAPVQVTFAGYPGSTGLAAIDYRLSDPYLDPPGEIDESIYREKTLRLPDSFWCYDPFDADEVVGPLPVSETGYVTFGCLNNFCKVNAAMVGLWGKVMVAVSRSRLVLLASQGSHRRRVVDQLGAAGIEPARVEFVVYGPRSEYLKVYHRIDVGLDSFPYNGHTTSLDSLWMGVPVVTLAGQTPVSRAGWCQLSNLGLGELAGRTPEQFVQIAVELASDQPRLRLLRRALRRRMETSPLMDAPRFARNVEAAYSQMWGAICRGV